jgi:serine/threonine protein phosphatase PrpC
MNIHQTSFGLAQSGDRPSRDSFTVRSWDQTVIAVLADGTGSSDTAREASERAVRSLVNDYETRPRNWTPQRALTEFTRRINRTLHQDSLSRFGEPELVTTLSVAVLEGDRLFGVNVGDSRVYLAREGRLTLLSRDHIADGRGFEHVLVKAIGLAPEVEPHCFEIELKDGDVACLCSDGVYNVLDESVLAKKLNARSVARSLVSEAREHSSAETGDDLSAIVLEIRTTGKSLAQKTAPLEIPARLHKGDVIDGFILERCLERNERVWLATRDRERITLKFAPFEARENEEISSRFTKEVWNACRLKDTRFFPRAFVPEGATRRYYAMEFIDAPSLKVLLNSRRLSVDECVALGKFLLVAAQYLLSFDLAHGDLKPENILVSSDFTSISFKLIDFGSVTDLFSITSRAGTATYLAPERFQEAPICERTEIFSVGVTLYEALTKTFPFGEIERFQKPRFNTARRPTTLNPNIPPWLEAVLLRAIAAGADPRYQNYSEMLFDLEHPQQVAPFFAENLSLIERDPLRFYRTGFFLLLTVVIVLVIALLRH